MSWVAVGTGAVSLGLSAFKYFKGRQQSKQAQRLRDSAVDPGFRPNQQLADNAALLADRYGNYTMPGYNTMIADIDQNAANALAAGVRGATSSQDVMSMALRSQYGATQAKNNLGIQNAMGQERALMDYLNANRAVGDDATRINMLELQRYDDQLREAAALQQAGAENQFSAIGEGIQGVSTMANTMFSPKWTFDSSGRMIQGDSMFNQWLNKRRKNG